MAEIDQLAQQLKQSSIASNSITPTRMTRRMIIEITLQPSTHIFKRRIYARRARRQFQPMSDDHMTPI
jgi:hypothetical protein